MSHSHARMEGVKVKLSIYILKKGELKYLPLIT